MSENIENLKSVLKICILANTTQTTLLGELFQEMTSRNPKALYILRNLEKFKNSIKIHFFYSRTCRKFQQSSRKQYKRAKAPIDLMLQIHLPVAKVLRLHKNVLQNNFIPWAKVHHDKHNSVTE